MRNISFVLILMMILGCASSKSFYTKYKIIDHVFLQLNDGDSIKVNQLIFKAKHNATDLQRFLFSEYGKWNKVIKTERNQNILVWDNIKLLEDNDELFTVFASGEDKEPLHFEFNGQKKQIEASHCFAIVFNANDIDCLQHSSKLKNSIAKFLVQGSKSISKKNELFKSEVTKIEN